MYTSTFIFDLTGTDEEFHRLNDSIAAQARAIPGFLGEESWHNEETGLESEVYYWDSLEALHQLIGMADHRVAKKAYSAWIGDYRVVVGQVLSTYGHPNLAISHAPSGDSIAALGSTDA